MKVENRKNGIKSNFVKIENCENRIKQKSQKRKMNPVKILKSNQIKLNQKS